MHGRRWIGLVSDGSVFGVAFVLAILGIAALWLAPVPVLLRDWSCDDSFYFSEIARRLATTGSSSFDGLNPTNGYQPLWLWLEVPIHWLDLGAENALRLTRTLEVLLAVVAFVLFAAAARRAGIRPWLVAILVPFFTSAWVLYIGMEAGASIAALALAAWRTVLFVEQPSARNATWLGLSLALAGLGRLDNLAFAAAVVGLCVLIRGADRLSTLAALFVAVGLPIASYLLWNWIVFGVPVPVSGLVKQWWSMAATDGGVERFMRRFGAMMTHKPVREGVILATVAVPVALFVCRRARGGARGFAVVMFGLAALALAKVVYYSATVEPYLATYAWYFVTNRLLRFVLILWVAGWLVGFLPQRWRDARWLTPVCALVVAVIGARALHDYRDRAARPDHDWEILSRHGATWLNEHLGEREVVGAFDAGVLGYFVERPVVNLDGLVQSHEFLERRRAGISLAEDLDRLGIDVLANCIVDPEHFLREKGLTAIAGDWELVHHDTSRRAEVEGRIMTFAVFRRR